MTSHHETPTIVSGLCESLPADKLSIADVLTLKYEVHSDISPLLGILPDATENVIVLLVTADSTAHYLGVEDDHGWEVLGTVEMDEEHDVHPAIGDRLDSVMEWAETYYTSETFAVLEKASR